MKVQVRLNAISSYQSQQSSPAIRDISVSGHTRHLHPRPYKTSPSPTETCICNTPPLAIHRRARNKWKRWNKVIPIAASLKPRESEQGKSTAIAWGCPSIKKQRNPCARKKSETTLNPTWNPTLNRPLLPWRHCICEFFVLIICQGLGWDLCHIPVRMHIGVGHDLVGSTISTIVIAIIEKVSASLYHCRCQVTKCARIDAIDWERWCVFAMYISGKLGTPVRINGALRAGNVFGFESWQCDETLLSLLPWHHSVAEKEDPVVRCPVSWISLLT